MKRTGGASPEDLDFPPNWDRLIEADAGETADAEDEQPDEDQSRPPIVSLLAASWAELVVFLAPCVAALACVRGLGFVTGTAALPWAAALSVAWWGLAGVVLLVVRRGTPGMLLAGLAFDGEVDRRRMPLVLLAVLLLAASAGVLTLVGGRAWLPGLAAGRTPSLTDGLSES